MKLQFEELTEIRDYLKAIDAKIDALENTTADRYIPRTQLAEDLDVSITKLMNHEYAGELKPYKLGKRVFYKQSDVNALIESNPKKFRGSKAHLNA